MIVRDLEQKLDMKVLTGQVGMDREITGMYAGDLLSWVMSHASRGDAWVTIHTHLNIIAVALLAEVSCIIIPEGVDVEEATIKKAQEEGIAILSTHMTSYQVCWKAHALFE